MWRFTCFFLALSSVGRGKSQCSALFLASTPRLLCFSCAHNFLSISPPLQKVCVLLIWLLDHWHPQWTGAICNYVNSRVSDLCLHSFVCVCDRMVHWIFDILIVYFLVGVVVVVELLDSNIKEHLQVWLWDRQQYQRAPSTKTAWALWCVIQLGGLDSSLA